MGIFIFLIFNPSFDQVSNIEPYHETRDKLNQLTELSNFKLKLMLESPERHPSQRFKMQCDHSLRKLPTITKKKIQIYPIMITFLLKKPFLRTANLSVLGYQAHRNKITSTQSLTGKFHPVSHYWNNTPLKK